MRMTPGPAQGNGPKTRDGGDQSQFQRSYSWSQRRGNPISLYRAAHVPVALSTDDEGVGRIDSTNEYVRAALDYHLSYQDLKQLARTGMEHNFLPGKSLWAAPDVLQIRLPLARRRFSAPTSPRPTARHFSTTAKRRRTVGAGAEVPGV